MLMTKEGGGMKGEDESSAWKWDGKEMTKGKATLICQQSVKELGTDVVAREKRLFTGSLPCFHFAFRPLKNGLLSTVDRRFLVSLKAQRP